MQSTFSAIAAGIGLALAGHVASAQALPPTVTVTQQGNGNTAYAEQAGPSSTDALITITQIGNNNHAGGPGATGNGIVQRSPGYRTYSVVEQNGTANSADIDQNQTFGQFVPVEATITQRCSGNDATIAQYIVGSSPADIAQDGSGNVASLTQTRSSDAALHATQSGVGNKVSIIQLESGHGGPRVTQAGEENAASVVVEYIDGHGTDIVQDGYQNKATSRQAYTDGAIGIVQQGVGNVAEGSQTGGSIQSQDIEQAGADNVASITQIFTPTGGFGSGNQASVIQAGDRNTATVRQYGSDYVANVHQSGSGNWTYVYQH